MERGEREGGRRRRTFPKNSRSISFDADHLPAHRSFRLKDLVSQGMLYIDLYIERERKRERERERERERRGERRNLDMYLIEQILNFLILFIHIFPLFIYICFTLFLFFIRGSIFSV